VTAAAAAVAVNEHMVAVARRLDPGRSVAGRPGPVSTVSEQAVGGGGEFPRGVLKIPHLRPASVDRPAFDRRSLQARPDPVAIPRWGRAGAAGTATSWLGPPNLAGS